MNLQRLNNQQMQICSNNGLINEKDLRHLIKREFEFITCDQMDELINSLSTLKRLEEGCKHRLTFQILLNE